MRKTQHNLLHNFYASHHQWLRGWLRKKLGCPDNAADIAQDTFIRILGAQQTRPIDEINEPRAYLTTIAKRIMVDFFRRADLERAYLEALAQFPEALQPSPEDRLETLQLLQQMDSLLAGLSPKARAAWLYSRLDGLKHAEIAELLGVSVPRVRQYLARAARQAYTLRFGSTESVSAEVLPITPLVSHE
ncbi:sigma-70 family RNA polymerase sigma factor [Methylobacillus caricis]|uniref:sigma-70 family RNA polymerase sigma factor n=1 Tax=Methylobacillus caricis TaxID=1971611 RepID=UPI001CFFD115|nr:sigma-70 family RNA polymerase sigma factor [Methylobacillus caricis]MCB5188573.1 sigma-70 family RNA polymerase sigma factor [Methylobacillus caricis]